MCEWCFHACALLVSLVETKINSVRTWVLRNERHVRVDDSAYIQMSLIEINLFGKCKLVAVVTPQSVLMSLR